ncbi:hypothetical protein [uncultured Chryseobacterium sp.]|uniref:hypothetical protein n=1 Tax=uncultured Chryseobacterium sp. TaxID=259322 RepID=UPI0025D98FB7|nr:hypothetical protein [uncultured Chryseobacterium sp.]
MIKNTILFSILFSTLYNSQSLNIKSPQSYEIERFGNIPVNLNVGGVDLSIPIFQENFESIGNFNLTLNYNSSGFIPNKKSNYVGHNWFLNFGGAISRDINGIADDSDSSEDTYTSKGFLVGARLSPKSNIDIYNGSYNSSFWKDHVSMNGYQYELRPDKFNFNFMGNSGYFYINNDGVPIVVSEDMNLKIDISNLSNQHNYGCTPADSEIIITDGKGIKYYFGGNHTNLEISYQMGNSKDPAHLLPNGQGIFSINSWYLRKVEYPNNHIIEIQYLKYKKIDSAFDLSDLGNFCTSTPPPQQSTFDFIEELFDYNKYVNQQNERFNYNYNTSTGGYHVWGDGSGFSYQAPYFQYTLTKKVFPSTISLDGKELVKFTYTRFQSLDNNYQPLKLSNIEIKNKNTVVKNVGFEYYRNKDRFFLISLNFPDNKKYTFDYYSKENLPKETTLGIDFWGYWNGGDENNNFLIPQYSFNTDTGDYQITGNSRNSNPNLINTALLKVINYPTKGNSTFYYEPHSYSRKIEKDFSSDFFPYLKNESGIVGGARISKIIDSDGTNTYTRDFKYIKNYGSGSNESSGIATQTLRYMEYVDYKNAGAGRTQMLKETAQNISENSLSSSPITYSEVAELKNNILQQKYYFSDYSTNPDNLTERNILAIDNDFKPYKLNKNFYIKYNSNDFQRGKLLKTEVFKDNSVIRKIENNYTTLSSHPLLQNKYFSRVQQVSSWIYYQKEFVYPFFLNSTITTDYISGNELKTIAEYIRDSSKHLNLSTEKIKYSDNNELKTVYQYPEDIRHGNQPQQNVTPYQSTPIMILKNMVGIPLITSHYKNDIFQNRQQVTFEYDQLNTFVLPKRNILYVEDKTIMTPGNGYAPALVPDPAYGIIQVTYDKYDSKGNLQQYKTKDGISTVIIWGYDQTQPIAKIEGAQLSNISQSLIDTIVNASNTDAQNGSETSEQNLISALDTFRSDASMSGYQISTYTYDPLIGVRSITPPSGIREYYRYDSANRLEKVIDSNNKVLKEFKYNYKN